MRSLVVPFLLLVGCASEPPQASSVASPIIGGLPSDDGRVVALSSAAGVFCSGVRVSPHVVLTAAHCLRPNIRVDGVAADGIWSHPDASTYPLAHDLGALHFATPSARFVELDRETELRAGDEVTLVGFGADETGGNGVRRVTMSRVKSVSGDRVTLEPAPGLSCGGDSGGAVLVRDRLVGIISSGDAECSEFSRFTWLAADPVGLGDLSACLERSGRGAGERCYRSEQCSTAACEDVGVGPYVRVCVDRCSVTCPLGTTCQRGECRPSGRAPGALGGACARASDCGFQALCDETGVCALQCVVGRSSCESGFECVPRGDGSLGVCLPASQTAGGGGCAASGRDVGGGAWWVLLLLLPRRRIRTQE